MILGCSLMVATSACGSKKDDASSGANSPGYTVDSNGSAGPGTGCAQQEVPIKAVPPDIMIVMDRSMSMTDDVNGKVCAGGSASGNGNCDTSSKWYQAKIAVETVVYATQSSVNWGLFWLGNEPTQCSAVGSPAVPITVGASYPLIQLALESEMFVGQLGTPTAAVVNNSVAYLRGVADSNPKYLLVATDGEPNCAYGNLNSNDAVGAAQAAANALAVGIPTFVVGIATTSSATATSALNSMAVSGGYPKSNAATQYYPVTDTASLEATLMQIVGMVASCFIPLTSVPTGDWSVAVWSTDAAGNTVEIPSDAANGWGYTDTSRGAIQLVGAACDNLMNGTYSDLSFVYNCIDHPIVM